MHTIKENAEALVLASKENRLEENADETRLDWIRLTLGFEHLRSRCTYTLSTSRKFMIQLGGKSSILF